jgi:hypothetical protein
MDHMKKSTKYSLFFIGTSKWIHSAPKYIGKRETISDKYRGKIAGTYGKFNLPMLS